METFQHFGRFHLLESEKFKDITVSLRILGENKEPYVSMRNLLAQILIDRGAHYPHKRDLSVMCDVCYGLTIDSKTTAYGKAHSLEFKFKTISDRYAADKPFEKAVSFVADLLRYPLINEATLSEAKVNVNASLLRYQDNPSQYAMIQACALAGKGSSLAVFSQGKKEIVDSITVDQLEEYYRRMLKTDRFDLFAIGDFKSQELLPRLRSEFAFLSEANQTQSAYSNLGLTYQTGHSERDVDQANLIQMYSLNAEIFDSEYIAHRLACVMLGQLPNSLLFAEVREARSLCYSIYSSMIQFDGLLTISTGIDIEKQAEVEALIEVQIDRLKTGNVDPKLLRTAQDMLISSLKSATDDVSSLINFYHQRALTIQDETLDSFAQRLSEVKIEDIRQAVSKWRKLVAYTVGKKVSA